MVELDPLGLDVEHLREVALEDHRGAAQADGAVALVEQRLRDDADRVREVDDPRVRRELAHAVGDARARPAPCAAPSRGRRSRSSPGRCSRTRAAPTRRPSAPPGRRRGSGSARRRRPRPPRRGSSSCASRAGWPARSSIRSRESRRRSRAAARSCRAATRSSTVSRSRSRTSPSITSGVYVEPAPTTASFTRRAARSRARTAQCRGSSTTPRHSLTAADARRLPRDRPAAVVLLLRLERVEVRLDRRVVEEAPREPIGTRRELERRLDVARRAGSSATRSSQDPRRRAASKTSSARARSGTCSRNVSTEIASSRADVRRDRASASPAAVGRRARATRARRRACAAAPRSRRSGSAYDSAVRLPPRRVRAVLDATRARTARRRRRVDDGHEPVARAARRRRRRSGRPRRGSRARAPADTGWLDGAAMSDSSALPKPPSSFDG